MKIEDKKKFLYIPRSPQQNIDVFNLSSDFYNNNTYYYYE